MGKPEIRPPATPKPLNRSSPKFAHVIKSETSAAVQTFVAIRQGVSSPENAILCVGNVYSDRKTHEGLIHTTLTRTSLFI